jgi:hypothetical protein
MKLMKEAQRQKEIEEAKNDQIEEKKLHWTF